MITFLKNMLTIGWGLPKLVAYIAPIIKIIGSEEFQKIMKTLYDSFTNAWLQLKKESPELPDVPTTEIQRVRIVDRIRYRLGLACLKISEQEYDYDSYCQYKGISGITEQDA